MTNVLTRTLAIIGSFAFSIATATARCSDYNNNEKQCTTKTEFVGNEKRAYYCTYVTPNCTLGNDEVPYSTMVELLRGELSKSGVAVDGPKAAVEAFQKQHGLKVTGEVDAETWQKLSK